MKKNKLRLKVAAGSIVLFMALTSCTKTDDKVVVITDTPTSPDMTDINIHGKVNRAAMKGMRDANGAEIGDSLDNDSTDFSLVDCYRWDGEIHGKTLVVNEADGSEYEMNILITLLPSSTNIYEGGLVLYIDEDNFVEAVVRGEAEGNHITIYYVQDRANTTGDLFTDGDKLCFYEVHNGEYSANWYKAMHRFVNESTTITFK